jgi:hypothetical protein
MIPYSIRELEFAAKQAADVYYRELMQWAAAKLRESQDGPWTPRDVLEQADKCSTIVPHCDPIVVEAMLRAYAVMLQKHSGEEG